MSERSLKSGQEVTESVSQSVHRPSRLDYRSSPLSPSQPFTFSRCRAVACFAFLLLFSSLLPLVRACVRSFTSFTAFTLFVRSFVRLFTVVHCRSLIQLLPKVGKFFRPSVRSFVRSASSLRFAVFRIGCLLLCRLSPPTLCATSCVRHSSLRLPPPSSVPPSVRPSRSRRLALPCTATQPRTPCALASSIATGDNTVTA